MGPYLLPNGSFLRQLGGDQPNMIGWGYHAPRAAHHLVPTPCYVVCRIDVSIHNRTTSPLLLAAADAGARMKGPVEILSNKLNQNRPHLLHWRFADGCSSLLSAHDAGGCPDDSLGMRSARNVPTTRR